MKKICIARYNLQVMLKSPCLMATLSQGTTLRWKKRERFSSSCVCSSGPRAAWLDLLTTRDLPVTRTALQVWGHCSICICLVSCLGGVTIFLSRWRARGWVVFVELGQSWTILPGPVPLTLSPHPPPKMSETHICSGEEGKGDLA